MSYTCTLKGSTLSLISATHSFHSTEYQYWYYDVKRWLRSVNGREGDTPIQPMSKAEIEWVKLHYLPKAIHI